MVSKGSALQWAAVIAATMVMSVLGLLMLGYIGMNLGLGSLVLGLLLGGLPIPLLAMLALWIDRYEKEPAWMLFLAFFWGATGAVFFSLIFNAINGKIFDAVLGAELSNVASGSLSAPFVEELAKGFALLVLFFWKKDEFDNVTDGIIYAAMIGLGFTLVEDALYYASSNAQGGLGGTLGTLIMRINGEYAHSFFTGFTGLGLGIARETTRKPLKVIAPVVGLGTAMFFHFLWNTSGVFGLAGYFGVYFLVMVPAFLFVIGLILFSQARERKVIRANLTPYVQTGILSAHDLETLCGFGGRTRALMAALQARGLAGVSRAGGSRGGRRRTPPARASTCSSWGRSAPERPSPHQPQHPESVRVLRLLVPPVSTAPWIRPKPRT